MSLWSAYGLRILLGLRFCFVDVRFYLERSAHW